MLKRDTKLPPWRLRFSQCDPAEMMPGYEPSSVSPAQQEQLDVFKFQTIKSDYAFLRDNPVLGEVVGFIFERVLFDRPINIKRHLFEIFQQPDIEEKIMEYGNNRKCQHNCPPNIEDVMDFGYQILEVPSINTSGIAPEGPVANPHEHLNLRICDDRMLSPEPHVMKHMKALYENRDSTLKSYDTNMDVACNKYMRDEHQDVSFIGAPQEVPMYGGDYIFLRNKRCGRSIAQYIGDIDEIPAKPWPYQPASRLESVPSFVNEEEMEGDITDTAERNSLSDGEMENQQKTPSIMRSQESCSELRKYFETDKKCREYELDQSSALEKIDDQHSHNSDQAEIL